MEPLRARLGAARGARRSCQPQNGGRLAARRGKFRPRQGGQRKEKGDWLGRCFEHRRLGGLRPLAGDRARRLDSLGVVAVALTIVGIHAFNVWRQSQRASTLDQAIAAMQEEATAVAKARDAVAAQQTATAKNIAAEQASLARADVAKAAAAAVMQNQPSQPPQVH